MRRQLTRTPSFLGPAGLPVQRPGGSSDPHPSFLGGSEHIPAFQTLYHPAFGGGGSSQLSGCPSFRVNLEQTSFQSIDMATSFMGYPVFEVYFGQASFQGIFWLLYQLSGWPSFQAQFQLSGNSSFVEKFVNFTFLVAIFFWLHWTHRMH